MTETDTERVGEPLVLGDTVRLTLDVADKLGEGDGEMLKLPMGDLEGV